MPDETRPKPRVFVSYAYASGDRVGVLAKALEAEGFEVWRDHGLNPGDDYRIKIETGLKAADAVLVCWTPAATVSDWVISEADDARQRDKLLPVMLQTCSIPKPFDRLHASNLSKWTGNAADPAFQKLVEAIRAKAEGREPVPTAWRRKWLTFGGATVAAGAVLTAVVNFADVKQGFDSVFNPAASERSLIATEAKVDQVLALLKAKSSQPLDADAETALRESIARLLSAQSGARGAAADKLASGDLAGAVTDLRAAALEGERAAAGLAETWSEIGALTFSQYTFDAISAYTRAVELDPDDPAARAQLGHLYMRTGKLDEARSAYRYIYESTDDEIWRALAAGSLGQLALRRGDDEEAEEYLTFALEIDTKAGNLEGQGADLLDLGVLNRSRGDLKTAETMFRHALELNVKAADPIGQAEAHRHLGQLMLDRRNMSAAEASFRTALQIAEQAQDIEGQAFVLAGLGDVARERKKIDEAGALYLESLDLAQQIGSKEIEAITLVNLGDLAEQRGDKTQAIEQLRTAMSLYQDMGFAEEASALQRRLRRAGAAPHPEGPEN